MIGLAAGCGQSHLVINDGALARNPRASDGGMVRS
jgi:hypothetical protein